MDNRSLADILIEARKYNKLKDDMLELATMVKVMYDSFLEVGFDENVAFSMTVEMVGIYLPK